MRDHFQHCTVFTIAHRLPTIIDCDTILVLERGEVAELGSPATLLESSDGLFSRLVDGTGPEASQFLRKAAAAAVPTEALAAAPPHILRAVSSELR